nr:MAG TPA: hypothetical protein [Bacteriophage sp.]
MRNARTMMRSFKAFRVFIILTSNQICHHEHDVVVCRFQSVHAPRHGFQLCLFLCFGGSGFFGLFLGFSLRVQLFGSVQVVHLHLLFFVPCVFCFYAGHVHHFLHVLAAVWVLGNGFVVAHLFHALHSIVVDGLCLGLEVAFRQVGAFNGVAVGVNNFHGLTLLSSGNAPPDVCIVRWGLDGIGCSI